MRYVVHPVACTSHTAYQALLDNLLRDLITPFGSAALKARLAKDLYLSIHKAGAWLRVGPSSFDTLILQDEGMPTLKLQALPVPPEAIADRKVDIFILPEVGPRIQFQVSPGETASRLFRSIGASNPRANAFKLRSRCDHREIHRKDKLAGRILQGEEFAIVPLPGGPGECDPRRPTSMLTQTQTKLISRSTYG
jgi:hypothetical protein